MANFPVTQNQRKCTPPYFCPAQLRTKLDKWIQNNTSGTIFGPAQCGADQALDIYFSDELCLALAQEKTIVVDYPGTLLRSQPTIDHFLFELLRRATQRAEAYGIPLPEDLKITGQTMPAGFQGVNRLYDWALNEYRILWVLKRFDAFYTQIREGDEAQLEILDVRSNPDYPYSLQVIATNGSFYDASFNEKHRIIGSKLFNDLKGPGRTIYFSHQMMPSTALFGQFRDFLSASYPEHPEVSDEGICKQLYAITGGFYNLSIQLLDALFELQETDGISDFQTLQSSFFESFEESTLYEEISSHWFPPNNVTDKIMLTLKHIAASAPDSYGWVSKASGPLPAKELGLLWLNPNSSLQCRLPAGLLKEYLLRWQPPQTPEEPPQPEPPRKLHPTL